MAYYGAPMALPYAMPANIHPFFLYGKKGMKSQYQIQKKMMKYHRMGFGWGAPPPMYANFVPPMMGAPMMGPPMMGPPMMGPPMYPPYA